MRSSIIRKTVKWLTTMFIVVTLTGCAAQPQVRYYTLKQDREGMHKFTLPKSYIHIDLVTSKEQGPFIDARSIPSDDYPESDEYSFMMQGVYKSTISTNITQFTTLPNTRIPSAVGSEVIDNRKEMIETFAKVADLAFLKAVPIVKFNATVVELKNAEKQDIPLNEGWKYSLKIGDAPKDALPIDEFKKMATDTDLKVFPYSACRTASLTVFWPNGKTESFKLKVADPAFVSIIEIPTKGQITMHPSCGVDVKSEKGMGGSVDWGLLGNLIQKVKNIKENINKAKN